MRFAIGVGRISLAGALAAALIASAVAATPLSRDNFFAFFATESSIVAIAAWALSGAFLLGRAPAPGWVHVLRGAAVTYALVLASCRLIIALPWQTSGGYPLSAVNVFVTLLAPLLLLADWALVGDRRPLSHSFLRWVPAFPVLWSTVTLLRGIQTDWTPYPLLNPATAGWRLPVYLGGTALVALAAGAIVSWMSRRAGLLPLDRRDAAVEAVGAVSPSLEQVLPVELPLPPVSPLAPSIAEPATAAESAAPLQAFRFVDPPSAAEAESEPDGLAPR